MWLSKKYPFLWVTSQGQPTCGIFGLSFFASSYFFLFDSQLSELYFCLLLLLLMAKYAIDDVTMYSVPSEMEPLFCFCLFSVAETEPSVSENSRLSSSSGPGRSVSKRLVIWWLYSGVRRRADPTQLNLGPHQFLPVLRNIHMGHLHELLHWSCTQHDDIL